ncbi:hypothetical protein TrLO_g5320 [Triparma laevis f. longispina]|uniref:Uncharacterized protein n=1 Tax=Triparma laevis f. longispina TaxID=1714387 RepID=A0A9W7FQ65_9STRA|nr:hypothetical protein TrLO_g5320 [Triparma laevis f. longispina]
MKLLLILSLVLAPSAAWHALIVQNKGGGHGELGYQLSKMIAAEGHTCTLLQDTACKQTSEPFSSYSTLPSSISVVPHDFTSPYTPTETYDYVWDNYSSDPTSPLTSSLLDHFKSRSLKRYNYVSSAGIYDPPEGFGSDTCGPLSESFSVNDSKGQTKVELALKNSDIPTFCFRPQYIYGEKQNKYVYLDYYFDRICNDLPVPIPGSGLQLASLTNSVSVASLLFSGSSPSETPFSVFNCGTSNIHTYNDVALMIGKVVGKSVEIVNDIKGKGGFPFRPNNFYVMPDKVKEELKWEELPTDLEGDLKWYYEDWKERREGKEVDLEKDKEAMGVAA